MKRKFTKLMAAFALLLFLAPPMIGWAADETITFSELNLENGVQYTTIEGTDCTLSFGDGANDGKYYTTGAAIRVYGGGHMTVSSTTKTIERIELTFGSGDGSNTITTDVNTYSNGTWQGSAQSSVTFNVGGTSGHRRIASVAITYTGGDIPTTYTVTYNANADGVSPVVDTYNEGATVTLRAANTFTNEGYTFSEWNTQADGDGDAYEAEGTIEDIQDDIELYAIWTENTIPSGTTATLNIQAYATANNWQNETKYTVATVTPVTFTANGGGNTGKYYTNGNNWRYYQNESASITISVPEGYTLVSVTPTYSVTNNGVLKNGNATIASGTTVSVSGTSVTFTVGNSGTATNGQVRFTNIDVVYVSEGGTQTASDLTITNESTDLTFDLYNNTTAQVISYTTSSTGAITITPTESDYFSYVHDAAAKTITVTPTAVTPSAQTVTINQAADDDYYAGTATFTVSITNSAPLANIVALTSQTIASTYNVALSDAVVTYVNGNYAYIQDASGAVAMYKSGHGLTAGDVLNGTATVTYQVRNGNPQITDLIGVTPVSGTAPDPTEVAASAWNYTFSNVLSQYFKVTGATITQDNNKYYVSLNNESIQLYKVGTAISNLDLNKTYSITGFPTMYNTTKELQIFVDPEVEASTEPSITVTPTTLNVEAGQHVVNDELTITFDNIDVVNYESFTIQFYNAEGEGQEMPEWLVLGVTGSNDEGYQVNGYISANEGEARSAYMKVSALDAGGTTVYSNLVTVNQAAYVAPFAPVLYTRATEIVSGHYIIVGFDDEDHNNAYAMGEQKNNNRAAVLISEDGTTATVTTADVHEVVITALEGDDNGYYTIEDGGYLYAASGSANQLKTKNDLDVNGKWKIAMENGEFSIAADKSSNRNVMQFNFTSNNQLFSCYASASQKPVYLYVKSDEAPSSYTLNVTGYGENEGGYVLIASPINNLNPATIEGMTTGDFDLYYFDQAEEDEWRNYETQSFNLVPGKGYLYAKKASSETPSYEFTLTGTPYQGNGEIELINSANAQFAGWNLVGNPFGVDAEISMDFYEMNEDGTGLVAGTEYVVDAMQGVFVQYTAEDPTVIFMPIETGTNTGSGEKLVMNVNGNRGNTIDRAIVRFGEGRQLPKFQLNPNNTKIYVTEGDQDFAVVRSAAEAEMPVSFRASENGTYTIAVEAENVNMNYLHLIDNMTGADVDLLATPNYTFEARTNDYTSRFRLVFSANGTTDNEVETFAYFNGSNWTVNNVGEATLQVVDVTGRIVSNETINGNATVSLNQPAGIYMLRLVSGNDVKVQKVVVK